MNKILRSLSHKTIVWIILVWIMLVTFLGSLPASYAAATPSHTPSSNAVLSSHAAQTGQMRALVAMALADVANIRALISQNKNNRLLDELLQIKTIVTLIEAARPTGEIDALMKFYQQHLSFEDTRQVLADIMPLYHALSALPPSKQSDLARQQLDQVKTNLEKGMHEDALTALEEMRRTLSVDGVDFPLQAAEEKLNSITNLYEDKQEPPKDSILLGLENDFMQILGALS